MLKIYGHFFSMPSNKVRLCVSFLELPHDYIHVDLQKGEHTTPEFLTINPECRVPAMDDDGFTLSQSDAICKYLCAISGPSSFYPSESQTQAVINQWIDFSSQHIQQAMARVFFNRVVTKLLGEDSDEASIAHGEKMLARDLPLINARLDKNEFLAGEKLTLADVTLAAALEPNEMVGVDLSDYPAIVKWREALMVRDFYQRVHKRFGAEMAD